MESNKTIKMSISTFVLIFAIFAIIIMAFVIYNLYNEKVSLTEKVNNANVQTNEEVKSETIDNTIPSNIAESKDDDSNKIDTNEKFVVPSLTTGTMKNPINNQKYKMWKIHSPYYSIEIENGTPYIYWYIAEEEYLKDLAKGWNATLNINQSQKITGFTKQVVDVHMGGMGHDFTGEVIIFQMEDGTIEYSTIENMMKNVSTQGEIEGLKNIVKLQDVLSYVEEGGGGPTIVAIDKDNNCYDLSEFIN